MRGIHLIALVASVCILFACSGRHHQSVPDPAVLESLSGLASTEGFQPYEGNPIVTMEPGCLSPAPGNQKFKFNRIFLS